MGMSADAVLFYGLVFDNTDEHGNDLEISDKIENYYGELRNKEIPQPTDENYKSDEWDAWRKKNEVWRQKQCESSFVGSLDYSDQTSLYIEESEKWVECGEVKEITSLEVKDFWDNKIKEYCDACELPYSQPKWFLVAKYG